jgi:transcriptional regulator with XRE-family HTH domain
MASNSLFPALYTPAELTREVGERAKALRLSLDLRQEDLARMAGVSVTTVKRFEATGQATFELVVRLLVALRAENAIGELFAPRRTHRSLDEVIISGTTHRRRSSRKRS